MSNNHKVTQLSTINLEQVNKSNKHQDNKTSLKPSQITLVPQNNNIKTKTKQVVSLQLEPQKRSESGGVLSFENS